ncbi:hypothetical protein L2Y90_34475 (plasmid) [Burkholderia pyrrocinia]|uniref:hypothetical protein n=1 Tax=Burkholderia pyrrocinia TaxID=60550 RepID=UPI00215AAD07|nr:hypothetical protein [Burkholderia pyrrocinia]UVE70214.1 hypothetical protein L2Y90_34475 [Burkholderia pyrrocinia]
MTHHPAAPTQTSPGLPLVQNIPFVVCPHCGNGAGHGYELISDFFYGKPLICEVCGGSSNAWVAYLTTINHVVPFLHDTAASFVGFKTAIFKVAISPSQRLQVKFTEFGIPAGSRLIRVNYTPAGSGVFPVELHGNEALVRHGRDEVWLYGVPQGDHSPEQSEPITVQIYVVFADPNDLNGQAEEGLVRAFVALSQNELVDMVIPAVMAVEFTCKRLLTDLKSHLSSIDERVKDKDLLSQVIPTAAGLVGLPPLADEICAKVSRLWGQRDAVAHTGRLYSPYERNAASMQLAAAVFAFRYLTLLRQKAVETGLI